MNKRHLGMPLVVLLYLKTDPKAEGSLVSWYVSIATKSVSLPDD